MKSMTKNICANGQGYVGLLLAIEFDRAGHQVTGYDIDYEKIDSLRDRIDPTG